MPEPLAAAVRPIRMNRNRWAPLAAVAAVVAVLVGVSLVSNGGGAVDPPLLRLASTETSMTASAVDAPGAYRLIGTLPDGPLEARVRDLSATAAPVTEVRRLAVALGEAEAPIRVDGAWKAGDLVVTDEPGNPWTWGASCAPDVPPPSYGTGAKDLTTSSCASATVSSGAGSTGTGSTGTVTPGAVSSAPSSGTGPTGTVHPGTVSSSTPPTNASTGATAPTSASKTSGSTGGSGACPSQPSVGAAVVCGPGVAPPVALRPRDVQVQVTVAAALAATAKVRNALGLDGAPIRVEGLSVVVDPLAGGRHTTGLTSLFQLSSRAALVSASGSLSTGRDGPLYPLRTARNAFDDIPAFALGAPCGATGCPPVAAVTGARLGLSRVALDGGAAAMVPAWLFAVQGSPVPLVALAVADRFVAGPDPGPGPAQTKPGTQRGTDPGSEPGNTAPDPGGLPRPPASEKPVVPNGREPFAFDGAYADADPTVVVVRYGDSGSCPSQGVHHDVVQDSARVVVTLTRTPMATDQPCTLDYRAMLVRITLTAPLGSREVIDGSRKQPVTLSTGTPPFG